MDRPCGTHLEKTTAYRLLVGKPEGKRPLGRPRRVGRVTLKWVLDKHDEMVCTGLIWLRIWTSGGLFRTR
jgi:hypothetical protein